MNKHCFRLIFSKSLGFLIPVAEVARTQRKSGQQRCAPSLLSGLTLSLLLTGLPNWTVAEIVIDPRNAAGTQVIAAPNGVPVIEIAAPNGKGLSHNRFSEFDVRNPGLIYNNSLVNGTSQLGGALLRNPNLSRAARAILTEVTGNNPSSITGTLEVFGSAADLLIANHKLVRQRVAGEAQGRFYSQPFTELVSTAMESGLKFDLIDVGRAGAGEFDSSLERFLFRNWMMAEKINSDHKYIRPGVVGVFGAEHLRSNIADDGIKEPTLQEMVNVPEYRVHLLAPLFIDFENKESYFSWSRLSESFPEYSQMSMSVPYKVRKDGPVVNSADGSEIFEARDNKIHLVVNSIGDRAATEIDRIKSEHPSTAVIFNVANSGSLDYVDGGAYSSERIAPTKVFLFTDEKNSSADTQRWLTQLQAKLDKDMALFATKEFYLSPEGELKLRPVQMAADEIHL